MNDDKEKFKYSYSAKQQDEIRKIRSKYISHTNEKAELIKKLDRQVTRKATMISLIEGIFSSLVMGFGMCCVLEWADKLFTIGIIIGIVGIIGVAFAYPIYNYIVKKETEKVAPKIIELSNELLQIENNI